MTKENQPDPTEKLAQQFELPDGRSLGFDEYGPADGRPVFYFHGVPSSRIDFNMFGSPELIEQLGIRLIAVDRPGCGMSDIQPGRRVEDWPSDVAKLADGLNISRFAVLGWSGGGPYALACAEALPKRITAAAVVSGMGPHNVDGLTEGINAQNMRFFKLNRDHPLMGRLMDRLMAFGVNSGADKFLSNTLATMPPVDRQAMSSPKVAQAYLDSVKECFRNSVRGGQIDTSLMVSPWSFNPRHIKVPVSIWHGGQDADAPPAMGHWLAENVPGSKGEFLPDEGHISLIVNHIGAILRSLIA